MRQPAASNTPVGQLQPVRASYAPGTSIRSTGRLPQVVGSDPPAPRPWPSGETARKFPQTQFYGSSAVSLADQRALQVDKLINVLTHLNPYCACTHTSCGRLRNNSAYLIAGLWFNQRKTSRSEGPANRRRISSPRCAVRCCTCSVIKPRAGALHGWPESRPALHQLRNHDCGSHLHPGHRQAAGHPCARVDAEFF